MYINKVVVPIGRGKKTYRGQYGSCWHIGNPSIHWEGIARFMEKAKKRLWWMVGDIVESILPGDKRFNVNEHKTTTLDNIKVATKYIKIANSTCMGIVMGNHERKASNTLGDITAKIANDAGVPYLGSVALLNMHIGTNICKLFTAHGSGSLGGNSGVPERDDVNMRIKLRRKLEPFEADIKAVGHYHRTIVAPATYRYKGKFTADSMKRVLEPSDPSWCVAAPSLFLNYSSDELTASYAEASLMRPTDIGWIEPVWNSDGSIACIDAVNEKGKIVESFEPIILH